MDLIGASMIKDREGKRRVLGVRLVGNRQVQLAWRSVDQIPGDLAGLGGSALAFALTVEVEQPRLVFALGEAASRGLPGAGRVHVGGRSPLTGGYTEGAVGGELAWALGNLGRDGGVCALYLEGFDEGAWVLDLEAGDGITAQCFDAGAERGAGELARLLVESAGALGASQVAAVAAGPGARRGVPFGVLVSGDGVPVVTGRGGLGSLLVQLGLVGLRIRITRDVVDSQDHRASGAVLASAASRSPRLLERARGGTLELFAAYASRGDLRGRNYSEKLDGDRGRGIARAAADARVGQHGCKGCPTPCGLVFQRGQSSGGARFGAAFALGPNLGLEQFEDTLELLAACDHEGLDAREVGACLGILARYFEAGGTPGGEAPEEPVRFGDLASLKRGLVCLPGMGSEQLGQRLGLSAESFVAGGQAARPEADLAAVLGQIVGSAGNDPMRSFPFLVSRPGGSGAQLPDGTAIDPAAFDPRDPTGKGQLVAWHEDLAAALDISGFCSFSAAGLLVDGAMSLDVLAEWVAPKTVSEGYGPSEIGGRWLAAGRRLVEARRAFDLGVRGPLRIPDWAAADLARPGMLDGYLAARGEGAAVESVPLVVASPPKIAGSKQGEVLVAASGNLGRALGIERAEGRARVALELPACRDDVLEALAGDFAKARGLLIGNDGRVLPGVWCDGRMVGARDRVRDGDLLELVLVIGGG